MLQLILDHVYSLDLYVCVRTSNIIARVCTHALYSYSVCAVVRYENSCNNIVIVLVNITSSARKKIQCFVFFK